MFINILLYEMWDVGKSILLYSSNEWIQMVRKDDLDLVARLKKIDSSMAN